MIFFGNLVFLNPDGTEKERLLLTRPAGPSNVSFIKLKHPDVSHEHCRVDITRDGQVSLTNLSITHPTRLNNKPVTRPTKVLHNDHITILDRSFRFELQPDMEHSPKKPNQPTQHREKEQSSDSQLPSPQKYKENSPKKRNQLNLLQEREQSPDLQLTSPESQISPRRKKKPITWRRVQLNGEKVCTEWNWHRVKAGYDTHTEFAYHLLRLHERCCNTCQKPDRTSSPTPTSPHTPDVETSDLGMPLWNTFSPERGTPPGTPPNLNDPEGSESNTGNTLLSTVLPTTNGGSGAVTPDMDADTPTPYFCSPSEQRMDMQQISTVEINQTCSTPGEDNVGPVKAAETMILDEDSKRHGIITISDDSSDDSSYDPEETLSVNEESICISSQEFQQTTSPVSSSTSGPKALQLPLPEQSQHTEKESSEQNSDLLRMLLSTSITNLNYRDTRNSVAETSTHQVAMSNDNMPMDVIQSTSSETTETLPGAPNVKLELDDSRKMAKQKDQCNGRLRLTKTKKRKMLYTEEENSSLSSTISKGGPEWRRERCYGALGAFVRRRKSSEQPSLLTANTLTPKNVSAQNQGVDSGLIQHRLDPHSASTTLAKMRKPTERENTDVISPVGTEGKVDNCSTFAELVTEVTTTAVDLPSPKVITPKKKRKRASKRTTLSFEERKGETNDKSADRREDVARVDINSNLFMCHECNSGFGDCWSCLVVHNTLGRTSEENPRKCKLCDTVFDDTEGVRRHMQDTHGIERYQEEHLCPDCMRVCTPCNPKST